ncbi:MAG: asparagine synthetase B, partial [Firmicutes bacterium]|nr:asparagine synthetase B [Bacillota bacterium]
EAVLARRKSPFPKTYDPHYYALCKETLLEILSDKSSPLNSLVDSGFIRQILSREGRVFSQPWFGQLMTDAQLLAYLIQVDTWMRTYRISLC